MHLNSPVDKAVFVEIAGSKSILNRLLIINSINKQKICLQPGSECEDVSTMLEALRALGLCYELCKHEIREIPEICCLFDKSTNDDIMINEAGTVFRFLLTRLALEEGGVFTLRVGEKLYSRPFLPLIHALQGLGADFEFPEDRAIVIRGKSLNGGRITLPANISSQFVTSILLSASLFKSSLEINFTPKYAPISSLPYIMMTLNLLKEFGVNCDFIEDTIYCSNTMPVFATEKLTVEPDYSTAPSFWVMGLLLQREIYVPVPHDESLQGDFAFSNILAKLGFEKNYEKQNEQHYLAFTGEFQHGLDISMRDMPDQVMNLVLLALFCQTQTIISDIAILRFKESDRIACLVQELKKIGADIEYLDERLIITPRELQDRPIELSSHNDHRLAMILLLLKQVLPSIIIDNTDCIRKSAPEFLSFFKNYL
ncbi:MAG TPA: hypothetical protein PLV22_02760 [Candidatus Cloacimonadota bacterium]|nr:hypothetical protein [Candidatus Cloacimonadota bacterium]